MVTPAAWAVEETDVASALDEEDPFDLHATVEYAFSLRRAAIKREVPGLSPAGSTAIAKDLLYRESTHTITPRVAIGVFRDLELSFALPIVIDDARELRFAEGVMSTNSSTLIDDLLPDGTAAGGMGYDAGDPLTNFAIDSRTVFRGVSRKGLDQAVFGIAWAPMNQQKDDTKPTWVIGAEGRLSIGKIRRFDRFDPESENGVSRGVHELRLYTAASKRLGWAEPFLSFYWLGILGTRGSTPEDPQGSLFWDVGFGQPNHRPQQRAGTSFGFEAALWEKPEQEQRVALTFRGRIDSIFEGMGYSEMWEIFAYAGDVANNPSGPLVLDRDPTSPAATPLSHPGTTVIENYLSFGGQVGLGGQVGPHARFNASFELGRDQSHRLTFTDAGTEGPDGDDVITPNTEEVNPLHKSIIDLPGRRYLLDGETTYTVFVSGSLLF